MTDNKNKRYANIVDDLEFKAILQKLHKDYNSLMDTFFSNYFAETNKSFIKYLNYLKEDIDKIFLYLINHNIQDPEEIEKQKSVSNRIKKYFHNLRKKARNIKAYTS